MTIELEQEFYDTFGIEPEKTQQVVGNGVFFNVIEDEYYPEITAEKLLEMICIKSKDNNGYRISANNHKSLKEEILKDLIKAYSTYIMCTWEEERGEKLKQQIQQLFKDEQ